MPLHPSLVKSPNQVVVSVVVVGSMWGEDDKGKKDVNAIDITALAFLKLHASYRTASVEHTKNSD